MYGFVMFVGRKNNWKSFCRYFINLAGNMLRIIILIAILLCASSYGQKKSSGTISKYRTTNKTLESKKYAIYKRYFYTGKYRMALNKLTDFFNKTQQTPTPFDLEQIGECYQGIHQLNSAIMYYHMCLADTNTMSATNWDPPQLSACYQISDVYRGKQMYDSALYYLNKATNEFLDLSICGNNSTLYHASLQESFARCFEGMNELDSAINHLTPYMFANIQRDVLGLNFYEKNCNYFLSLLYKRYTKEQLQNYLSQTINSICYESNFDTTHARVDNYTRCTIHCSTQFIGESIILCGVTMSHHGTKYNSVETKFPWYWTQNFIEYELKNTYVYKEIMK